MPRYKLKYNSLDQRTGADCICLTDQRVEVDSADLPLDPVESCRKMGSGHKVSGSSWSFLVKLWS